MKCVIEGGNVKGATGRRKGGGLGGAVCPHLTPPPRLPPSALGHAVHALSRVGDHLYLEPSDAGVGAG